MGLLEEGLARLSLPADSVRLSRLGTYLAELELWNPRLGLVKAEGDELIVRHILDSLGGLALVRSLPHATVADVGSGAGLPGIPLALFLDDARFALIERSGRRVSFLRNATLLCDLAPRVEVIESDLERVDRQFEVVVLRALAPLPEVVGPLLRLVKAGGSLVAYKGRRALVDEELSALGVEDAGESVTTGSASNPLREGARGEAAGAGAARTARVVPIEVPFLGEERHLVVLSR